MLAFKCHRGSVSPKKKLRQKARSIYGLLWVSTGKAWSLTDFSQPVVCAENSWHAQSWWCVLKGGFLDRKKDVHIFFFKLDVFRSQLRSIKKTYLLHTNVPLFLELIRQASPAHSLISIILILYLKKFVLSSIKTKMSKKNFGNTNSWFPAHQMKGVSFFVGGILSLHILVSMLYFHKINNPKSRCPHLKFLFQKKKNFTWENNKTNKHCQHKQNEVYSWTGAIFKKT